MRHARSSAAIAGYVETHAGGSETRPYFFFSILLRIGFTDLR